MIYPNSPVSPYGRVPPYAGWSPLPPPSPQPTRSVVTIARAGTCLSESRLRHVGTLGGGNGSMRAVTAVDPHGSCSVSSFYDVRGAVAFFDAITKVTLKRRRDGKCMAYVCSACGPQCRPPPPPWHPRCREQWWAAQVNASAVGPDQ